jgi:hypothetical protein
MMLPLLFCLWFHENGLSPLEPSEKPWQFSGWVDSVAFWSEQEASQTRLEVSHLYLVNRFSWQERWSALVELALERELQRSNLHPERTLELERAFLQYQGSSNWKILLGKFYNPCGLYKQQHWAYTMDTFQIPLIEEQPYIPEHALGVQFQGKKAFRRSLFRYTVLASDGDPEAEHPLDDDFGAGADLNLNLNDRFLSGISYYRYRHQGPGAGFFDATQVYLAWDLITHRLQWRGEWLFFQRDQEQEQDGYYQQLKWHLSPSVYFSLRVEAAQDQFNLEAPKQEATLLTLGLRSPLRWRFKLEFAENRFPESERNEERQVALWVGYAF